MVKIIFVCNYYNDPRFSPHFLSFTGAIYHRLGQNQVAIRLWKQILKKYPKFGYASIIQCAIGIVYEANLKDARNALDAYQKVLKNYPKSLEVAVAKAGIKRLTGK